MRNGILLIGMYLLSFAACRHSSVPVNRVASVQKTKGINLIKLFLGNGVQVFRYNSFGDSIKAVQRMEKKAADKADTNYLFYTFPIDTVYSDSVNEEIDSMRYFTVAYNFDQQRLNEADEDIYLPADSVAAVVAQRFTNYFTTKYGKAAAGSDALVWSFFKNGKQVEITLSNQSDEYNYGKLSLVFYCEDY